MFANTYEPYTHFVLIALYLQVDKFSVSQNTAELKCKASVIQHV